MLNTNIPTLTEENIDKELLNELLNDFNENINNDINTNANTNALNKLLKTAFSQIQNNKNDALQLYYQPIMKTG